MPPEIAPPAAPTTDVITAPAATPARASLAERASALRAELGDSTIDEDDAGEDDDGGSQETHGKPAGAVKPVTPPPADPTKSRAGRMARIEALRAQEAEAQRTREQRRASRAQTGELEQLRVKIRELEPLNDVFKSEDALLSAAEAKGMTPDKLVAWMRKRASDPTAVAQHASQSVEEKLRKEIDAANKRTENLEAKLERERQEQAEAAQSTARATSFVERAQSEGAEYPLSAALLKRHGASGLVAFANQFIVPLLPEGYEIDALHDHLEQFLEETQVGGTPAAHAAPAPPAQATPKKNGEAKPITTLSNDVVGSRETVTEEIPLHRLSKKDRFARVRAEADRE